MDVPGGGSKCHDFRFQAGESFFKTSEYSLRSSMFLSTRLLFWWGVVGKASMPATKESMVLIVDLFDHPGSLYSSRILGFL
jgi:hypothetical protein